VHPEPVEGTELVKVLRKSQQGFDRLSPNGMGFVFGSFVFPIILSLSKDKLSPNRFRGACESWKHQLDTTTPFQNAIRPLMLAAASVGSG
jgi:hypothetical protein